MQANLCKQVLAVICSQRMVRRPDVVRDLAQMCRVNPRTIQTQFQRLLAHKPPLIKKVAELTYTATPSGHRVNQANLVQEETGYSVQHTE